MSFQSKEEKDRYLIELRDQAAVAAMQGLLMGNRGLRYDEYATEAMYYADTLVAELYPEEVES